MGEMTMTPYTWALKSRYMTGNRKTKSLILDEFCATSGYNHKSVIRLLTRESPTGPKVFPPLNLPPQSNPVHRSSTRAGGEEKSGSSPIIQGFLFGGAECGIVDY